MKMNKLKTIENLAALWKLRWRHANTMVHLFEELNAHWTYYYTADGLGPSTTPWIEEYAEGHFVQYKHQPQEWIEIWQKVADKLLNKVREMNDMVKRINEAEIPEEQKQRRATMRELAKCQAPAGGEGQLLMNEDERQLFAKIGEIMVCMASNSNVYSYQLAEMIGDYARKVESLKVKDENGSN